MLKDIVSGCITIAGILVMIVAAILTMAGTDFSSAFLSAIWRLLG